MAGQIWRCLLAISFASVTFVQATEGSNYGVGFELSLDYGVASIYIANGSTVDVAKIEGSPTYKQMMRTINTKDLTDNKHWTLIPAIGTQAPFGLQSLRDYLPPWLGGNHSHTGSSESLSRMLKALKTATESYLETPLSTARVALPFPITGSTFNVLRSTASSLSLHIPGYALPLAGRQAAYAHGIGVGCDDDYPAEQLYLTVEYTRAALTALLVYEDCEIHENKRVLHDIHLGTDSLSERSPTSRRAELMSAFRDITKLPLNDGGEGGEVKWISNLVLLGESADDCLLHDVLKDVLSEQQPGRLVSAAAGPEGPIDPVFAASRGLAWDDWDRKNYEEPQGCPISFPPKIKDDDFDDCNKVR